MWAGGGTKKRGAVKNVSQPQHSPKSMTPNEAGRDEILKKSGAFNSGMNAGMRC